MVLSLEAALAPTQYKPTTTHETWPIIWTVSITPQTESLCLTTDWQDQRWITWQVQFKVLGRFLWVQFVWHDDSCKNTIDSVARLAVNGVKLRASSNNISNLEFAALFYCWGVWFVLKDCLHFCISILASSCLEHGAIAEDRRLVIGSRIAGIGSCCGI